MTIQINSDSFLAMLHSEGVTDTNEIQLRLNNVNEALARMPNFTADDLRTVLQIIAKGFHQ